MSERLNFDIQAYPPERKNLGGDRCVCCGEIVPEGRWVCPICAGEFGGNMK